MGRVPGHSESVYGHGLRPRRRALHTTTEIERKQPSSSPHSAPYSWLLLALPRPSSKMLRGRGRARPQLPPLKRHHLQRSEAREHPAQLRRPHQDRRFRLREALLDDRMDAVRYPRLPRA